MYENGSENVEHQKINYTLGSKSHFGNLYHSWGKRSVENAVGLMRRSLPKKTDFVTVSHQQIIISALTAKHLQRYLTQVLHLLVECNFLMNGNKKNNKRFLILGVGNILLRDEGLGVRAAEYIKERYFIPEDVSIVDGGTGGLNLLSLIREFDYIIILDAVASRSSPGAIYRIPGKDLPKSPPLMTTAHQLGVQDMLAIADLEGCNPDVVIIGMEPKDISLGLELSNVVREMLPHIADMVAKELKGFGVDIREKTAHA